LSNFRKVFCNRDFTLLWAGQIISQLGDRLSQMALIGLVYVKAPGSSLQIAKLLSFTIIPVFLIGPLAGAYVDRWDRRKTMYVCDLLRALLVVIIPLFLFNKGSFIWIYLIIFLAFSIGRFFVPAKLSIIPQLVGQKDLLLANSLINTTGMIAAVLGFGISGLIVEWLGAQSGFFLDSISFLVSGILIFLISRKNGHHKVDIKELSRDLVKAIQKSIWHDVKEGVVYFLKAKEIRFTSSLIFGLWSALGAVYVVIIVFVQNMLHSGTRDLGLLIMFLGIGLFLGSLVYGRFGQRISHYKIIFYSLVASGIMLIGFVLGISYYPDFSIAALLALLLGMVIAPIMIASNTIIHNASDQQMMGKIFSSLEIVMHLAFLVFMFLTSILAEHIPPQYILVTVGTTIAALGIFQLVVHRKTPW